MNYPRLLILGNGGAAAHAIQAARSSGHKGEILLVSDTSGPAFNPMIAPYFLAGKIDFDHCFPFGMKFYKDFDVHCCFGSPVEKLDPVNRDVYLGDGKRLNYDHCLVATGARPVLPPVQGLNNSTHVFMFRTSKDTLRLQQALVGAKTVVILGTSFVGLKLAEICLKRNMEVKLVDVAECVLPQCTTPECASAIEDMLIHGGASLYMEQTLEKVEDRGNHVHMHFLGDLSLSADLCIACTGVRPNLDFLMNSEVEVDQGILVNDQMKASAKGLYAAGDVSQGMNLLSGQRESIGLWGNACYQGRTAGHNMAGREVRYQGTILHNVTRIMDATFATIGDVHGTAKHVRVLLKQNTHNDSRIELIFNGRELVGANLLNNLQIAGKIKAAIMHQWNLPEYLNSPSDTFTEDELDRMLTISKLR
jgi:NADPH-dependent 2,4-dienoyl-CoA reductase/sulfur reductase-like enzyme